MPFPKLTSAWTIRPLSPRWMACSCAPKAACRNSSAACAFAYFNDGNTVGLVMAADWQLALEVSWTELTLGRDATQLEQRRAERLRRRAAELAEVAIHVRLVVIPAVVGDLRQLCRRRSERPHRVIEAHHPPDRLRCEADLLAEADDQPPVAPAQLVRELPDRGTSLSSPQLLPGPVDSTRRLTRRVEPPEQEPLDQVEPLRPRRLTESLDELVRLRCDVGESDCAVGELVHRQPEDAVRRDRRQPQLDARPRGPGRTNERRRRVQAGDEARFALARHRSVDLPGRVEPEDQRHAGERDLAQLCLSRVRLLPTLDRPEQVRAERRRGQPALDVHL